MYAFSGKPAGRLSLIPGKYVRLDVARNRPRRKAVVTYEVYANITYALTDPTVAGRLRVRLVREPFKGRAADPTGYQDFWLMPGHSSLLVTHSHWELAQAGRGLHWEIKIEGATGSVGTRYSKSTPV